MKIVIEGTAKEIADLVSEVQGRPGKEAREKLAKLLNTDFSDKPLVFNSASVDEAEVREIVEDMLDEKHLSALRALGWTEEMLADSVVMQKRAAKECADAANKAVPC